MKFTPVVVVFTSTTGASPVMVITSSRVPTFSVVFTVSVVFRVIWMFSRTTEPNPGRAKLTVYTPVGSAGKT